MRALKYVLAFSAVLFTAFIGVGLSLSKEYTVSRSIIIDAPAEKVHHYVGDLAMWPVWEPWSAADPKMKITPGEKTRGVGATQSWQGSTESGRLIFTQSDPQTGIAYDFFMNPGNTLSKATLIYEPYNQSTKVTWSFSGKVDNQVLGGYFAAIVDNAVGPKFAFGLEKLKRAVEENRKPKAAPSPTKQQDQTAN